VSEQLPAGGIQQSPTDIDAHMTSAQRGTLAELLARVHPGHPWLTHL